MVIEGSDPDPDPYLWLMDPDSDPGGPKTNGSATLALSLFTFTIRLKFLLNFSQLLEGLPSLPLVEFPQFSLLIGCRKNPRRCELYISLATFGTFVRAIGSFMKAGKSLRKRVSERIFTICKCKYSSHDTKTLRCILSKAVGNGVGMTRACRSRERISNIFSLCSILGMPLELEKNSFYLVTSASKKSKMLPIVTYVY